jgi:hypothetical protein
MTDPRKKYEDRLLETALREKLTGKHPPDLAERVLAAAANRQAQANNGSLRRWLSVRALTLLAVSAGLLLAVGLASWRMREANRSQSAAPVASAAATTFSSDPKGLSSVDAAKTSDEMLVEAEAQTRRFQAQNHLKQVELALQSQSEGELHLVEGVQAASPPTQNYAAYGSESSYGAGMAMGYGGASYGGGLPGVQASAASGYSGMGGYPGYGNDQAYETYGAHRSELRMLVTPRIILDSEASNSPTPTHYYQERQSLASKKSGLEAEAARVQESLVEAKAQNGKLADLTQLEKKLQEFDEPRTTRTAAPNEVAELRRELLAANDVEQQLAAVDRVGKFLKQVRDDEGRGPGEGGDRYAQIVENEFLRTLDNPLSTFSIDVDTASYY